MANEAIRQMANDKGVRLWQIAERLNINDGNFSRKLRRELPDEEQIAITAIINSLAEEGSAKNDAISKAT